MIAVRRARTMTLIIGFERSNATNTSRQEQIDTARFSVETMSKTIRTAAKPVQISGACSPSMCPQDAFLLGADFGVQFYANLNNEGGSVGPSRVTYTVATSGPTAGQLIETVQRPDPDGPTSTGFAYRPAIAECFRRLPAALLLPSPRRGVLTQTGAPIFAFYTKGAMCGSTRPPPWGHHLVRRWRGGRGRDRAERAGPNATSKRRPDAVHPACDAAQRAGNDPAAGR